jgi:hypothetical protein
MPDARNQKSAAGCWLGVWSMDDERERRGERRQERWQVVSTTNTNTRSSQI